MSNPAMCRAHQLAQKEGGKSFIKNFARWMFPGAAPGTL
jgi:hypothetical protein